MLVCVEHDVKEDLGAIEVCVEHEDTEVAIEVVCVEHEDTDVAIEVCVEHEDTKAVGTIEQERVGSDEAVVVGYAPAGQCRLGLATVEREREPQATNAAEHRASRPDGC